jgi:ESS family glutamate:Na+ symporter
MEAALFMASGLLLLGVILRARVRLFQLLYLPASVIGGIVGLGIVTVLRSLLTDPQAQGKQLGADSPDRWTELLQWLTVDVVGVLRTWPGWLIAIVFAGLLLERPGRSLRESLRRAVRQGVVVWIIAVGQIAFGLLATWLVLSRMFNVPAYFGQLIEIGFVGGHGTAGAISAVYNSSDMIDFPDGQDLAFFFATVGLAYSVVSGMVFVNLAVRLGWTRAGKVEIPRLTGLEARRQPEPIAYGRIGAEVIDPLVFQALILAAAVVVGMGLKVAVNGFAGMVEDLLGAEDIKKYADNLPLFMFTLIGGLMVRETMRWLKVDDLIDPDGIRRITGAAMEFLIVAAVTALNLQAVAKQIWPVTVLLLIAFAWTALCLLVIGRRLLTKGYWFELGIINYGMSTGTTAQGLMLVRIIDKDLESGAAEDYALAAPLSAPFIGGGIITVFLPQILQQAGIAAVAISSVVLLAVLCAIGLKLADKPQ